MMPNGWKFHQLDELIDSMNAGVSVNSDDSSDLGNGPRVLKTSSVTSGIFLPEESKRIVDTEVTKARISPIADSIIMSRMNTQALVGASAYVAESHDSLFLPDRLWLLRDSKKQISIKWLSCVLGSGRMRSRISAIATGTSGSMKNISKESILSLEILTPPKTEQEKIAKIFSTWDEAIEKLTKLLNTQKNEQHFFLNMFLSQKEKKGSTFGNYFRVRNGYAFKSADFRDVGVPLIRISNIVDGVVGTDGAFLPTEYQEKYKDFLVIKGDVLIAMSGATTGKFGIYQFDKPSLLNQRVGKFQAVDSKSVDPRVVRYVLYHLQSKIFEIAAGGAQPNISSSSIEAIPLTLPDISKQRLICDLFDSIESSISINSRRLNLILQQKQGLMQQLLTGKKRVKV